MKPNKFLTFSHTHPSVHAETCKAFKQQWKLNTPETEWRLSEGLTAPRWLCNWWCEHVTISLAAMTHNIYNYTHTAINKQRNVSQANPPFRGSRQWHVHIVNTTRNAISRAFTWFHVLSRELTCAHVLSRYCHQWDFAVLNLQRYHVFNIRVNVNCVKLRARARAPEAENR